MLIPKPVYKSLHWNERFVGWGFEEVLFFLLCKRHQIQLKWINSLLGIHDDYNEKRFSFNTETNRVYTMLYKHIFEDPSIPNLIMLESAGFLQYLVKNSIRHLLCPKNLVSFIFSYVHSWVVGHLRFLEDLSKLKY